MPDIDILRFEIVVLRFVIDELIFIIDELIVAIDVLRFTIEVLIVVIDDVFSITDAFMFVINDIFDDIVEKLLKVVIVEPRVVTDVLSDKTGCIKYLFNKYIELWLRSTLAAIMYIIILIF
jgi:hypothetical protein